MSDRKLGRPVKNVKKSFSTNNLFSNTTKKIGDKFFFGSTLFASCFILLLLFGVSLFLTVKAFPAFLANPKDISGGAGFISYVFPLVIGTLIAATIALLLATPVALGVALFISHLAPRKISTILGYVIDLLAAIPSVVYGLWGWLVLAKHIRPIFDWLYENFSWIPIFAGPPSATGRTMLTVGIVLSVMILPIITSVSREVFLQTPKLHEEAALALGATRWEMIRMSVLPFGRPGIISAIMLGLGRALGETLAVAMILAPGVLTASIITSGNQTIAAEIAQNFPEASGLRLSVLIAAGLVLFVITLIVNILARIIVNKRKEFSGAN